MYCIAYTKDPLIITFAFFIAFGREKVWTNLAPPDFATVDSTSIEVVLELKMYEKMSRYMRWITETCLICNHIVSTLLQPSRPLIRRQYTSREVFEASIEAIKPYYEVEAAYLLY